MVLDAIAYFRDKMHSRLPICMTDTQSAHDTATLVLDAVEVFTASYSDPEALTVFLKKINDLIISFSKAQADAIGECLSSPGHIMEASTTVGRGISISDDNLAVCSPQVNEKFLLPFNDELGEAFGGLAIHSCGNWAHTMPLVAKMKNICMIDCALSNEVDPNPNTPEAVRDAFRGTDVIVQVRPGRTLDKVFDLVKRVWAEDLRLIVKIQAAENDLLVEQYEKVTRFVSELYGI